MLLERERVQGLKHVWRAGLELLRNLELSRVADGADVAPLQSRKDNENSITGKNHNGSW